MNTHPISKDTPIKGKIYNQDIFIKGKISQSQNVIKASLAKDVADATTRTKGIIRIATDEEAIDSTSINTAITPHTLRLATYYEHEQGVASEIWVIHHNLNKNPSITVVDSANNVVQGAKKYIDENTIEIYFNGAFTGKAYLN